MKTKQRRRKRKKKIRLTAVITILVLTLLAAGVLYMMQKPIVELSDQLRFPIGESVKVGEVVKSVKNGTLLNGDESFDSHRVGTQSVNISVKARNGSVFDRSVTVEFYDATAPVITGPDSLLVSVGKTVELGGGFSALDDTGEACAVTFSGDYDTDTPGTYDLTATARDGAGNEAKKAFSLTILPLPYDQNGKLIDGTYLTEKGFEIKVKNSVATVDGYLLANKSYSLPKSYNPAGLTSETSKAFAKMQSAAEKDGISLFIRSGFRTWEYQNTLFNGYVQRDGLSYALTTSARPGHSEHQSGLGIDIVTASTKESKTPAIAAKLAWLNENAYRYGFILRYPEGKTDITGYIFEPWHYRYVGTELAQKLYNNGDWITMEEYFGVESVYLGY